MDSELENTGPERGPVRPDGPDGGPRPRPPLPTPTPTPTPAPLPPLPLPTPLPVPVPVPPLPLPTPVPLPVPLPTPLPLPLPLPLPVPLPTGLPCDAAGMLPLLNRVFRVTTVLEGSADPIGSRAATPGTVLRVQTAVADSALNAIDPLVQLLLSSPVQFGLSLAREGAPAGAQEYRVLPDSNPTASPQRSSILRFLPRPRVVDARSGDPAEQWELQLHAIVNVPTCPAPVDAVLVRIPFGLLPLKVPAVFLAFDARSYEQGFFVATPGIPGIAETFDYCDDSHNTALRQPTWMAIRNLLTAVIEVASVLSIFGPPFPSATEAQYCRQMLTKADGRVSSNHDYAIIVGDCDDLGRIKLWWGASCNDLASSVFLISAPNGAALEAYFDPRYSRPSPPPRFRVPGDHLMASLTTLWSLDTDTVRPLDPAAYSSWYRGIASGDNFAYNEISSYRWT